MRTDSEIKKDVEDELRWDPDIDATDVGVAVHNGVVALTGFVRSYMQKTQAERDVKRVAGVMAVANDVEVRLPYINKRPDPEIARDAVDRVFLTGGTALVPAVRRLFEDRFGADRLVGGGEFVSVAEGLALMGAL